MNLRRIASSIVSTLLILAAWSPATAAASSIDLILGGTDVWTGFRSETEIDAVAIAENKIVALGAIAEIVALADPSTRIVTFEGGLIVPGLIDNHTHFDRAGALILGINLLDISDSVGLRDRLREAIARLPEGAWVLGGDWGAYEAWEKSSTGTGDRSEPADFSPDKTSIDSVSPHNPVLVSKWDRTAYLANTLALERSSATCGWEGVECDSAGRPTGRLSAGAAERIRAASPAKSQAQRLAEARAALERLRSFGVTGIHDITGPDQMRVFQHLEDNGELTVRVYARPTLDRWQQLSELGIAHGFGSEYLKVGGLKGFVDGIMGNSTARFYQPYLTSGNRGSWREMMMPAGNLEDLLLGADRAGHWPQVHAIGDEAIDRLLEAFETLLASGSDRERRLRVIHAQVLRGPQVAAKMARLGIIAEVQPYHCIDDMRWMGERIGDRARWAYAFKTLHDAGVLLSFGSDWPGTNASWYPANPMLGIYAAVTRQTLEGEPRGGWFPEERIDVETALRAYTINNAWAAGEEDIKGTLEVGKLADLAVLDRNILEIDPREIKSVDVIMTVVDGRVVFEVDPSSH